MLKGAVVGTSALTADAQHQHTAPAKAAAPAGPWKPMLFDAHQNETVVVLSELIIPATDTPGAKEALVNEYIDLILHDGAPERRNRFLQGLGWLDGYAIRSHGKPFVRCTQPQQIEMLTKLDSATADELKTGADFFRDMKTLTVSGYYTTKIGIAELNKGGRVPAQYGCNGKDH